MSAAGSLIRRQYTRPSSDNWKKPNTPDTSDWGAKEGRRSLLDLILTKQETGQGCKGWRTNLTSLTMRAEFGILRGRKKANSRITTLDLRKAVFGLVWRSAWKSPVAHGPEERSRRACWFFKYHLLQDKQENKQMLTKELLTKLRHKEETYRR